MPRTKDDEEQSNSDNEEVDNSDNSDNSDNEEVVKQTKKAVKKTTEEPSPQEEKVNAYINLAKSDVNVKKIVLGEMNDYTIQKFASMSLTDENGKNSSIAILLPKIKLTQGAIPKLSEPDSKAEWAIKSDDKREYVTVPIDPKQESSFDILNNHFGKIDEFMSSESTSKKLFGDEHTKYQYQPIIREPSDESKKKRLKEKKEPYCNTFKVHFNSKKEPHRLITNVSIITKGKNGEKIKTKEMPSTVTEMEKIITWNSSIQFVMLYSGIWAQKSAIVKGSKKLYGIKLKMLTVDVYPAQATQSYTNIDINSEDEDDAELNSKLDDDEKPAQKKSSKKPVADDEPTPAKKSSKKPVVNDDDDDEPTPPKKSSKKPVADDDDDEPAPPKKPSKKPVADDDDDEPTPPKKPSKKPVVSDDDDDEPTPSKKPSKKPVADDDDEPPKKPSKKPSKKPVEDDDNEEQLSDDEPAPPKKSSKKPIDDDDDTISVPKKKSGKSGK